MKSDYEERRQARIDRYKELAGANYSKSAELGNQADTMARAIPLGQPILVGHHSEKRDRRFREKIHNKFRQSAEAIDKAKHYERKAASAENNRAISSDDPKAIDKLEAKIAKLIEFQDLMKAANKIIKKKKLSAAEKVIQLIGLKIPEKAAQKLLEPDFCGRIGFPPFELTNNNANIRRLKGRLEALKRAEQDQTTSKMVGDVEIIDNVEENRVQIFFPGKPSEEVRSYLKSNGFRWSRTVGAWQRHRSNAAMYWAEKALELE